MWQNSPDHNIDVILPSQDIGDTAFYAEVGSESAKRVPSLVAPIGRVWAIWYLDSLPEHTGGAEMSTGLDLTQAKFTGRISPGETVVPLDMMPPNSPQVIESPLKTAGPLQYLADRYFATLYQSMPLEYFTKTTLPKVHILAKDETKDTLTKFIMTVDKFDTRHPFIDSETWLDPVTFLHESENVYRDKFWHETRQSADSTSLLSKLKMREAKLQILLTLEVLPLLAEASTTKDTKRTRPKLVGRKKRLVPTFTGTVVSYSHTSPQKPQVLDTATAETYIKTMFDRLCVWDAISGVTAHGDHSSFSFLRTSVIPFYAKKHRRLLKELVKRSKGLNPEQHYHHHHVSKPRPRAKLVRQPLPTSFKLKRTSSSFASREDLSKKTFEMVKTASFRRTESSSPPPSLQPVAPPPRLNSIFTHSKKRKLVAHKASKIEVTEIEATPEKKRVINLQETLMSPIATGSPIVTRSPIAGSPIVTTTQSPVAMQSTMVSSPIVRATPAKNNNGLCMESTVINSPVKRRKLQFENI